ncbi:MAG TPA: hypothetical protein VHB30_06520, partial [Solirubrobacteraceae bacterium]|nr:hypothetical protein [Solirubrobacteraceae bacterium]
SDDLIASTAAIAAELGLAYYDPVTAERLVDKAAQRRALRAAGIPVPEHWLIAPGAGEDEVGEVAGRIRYPAVLKPRQGQGSRNAFAVGDAADLRAALRDLGGARRDFAVIVEEYLPDRATSDPDFAGYLSVESVVLDGAIHHVTSTGRFPPMAPFRETGFFIPSALPADVLAEVLAVVDAAIPALGIRRGALHTEVKLTPDGPRVIEVNGRLGGGVAGMLASVSDVNFFRLALDVAAGELVPPALPLALDRVAYLFYVQATVGHATVAAIEGLDDVGRHPGVRDVFLNRPPGSIVDWHDGNHGYVYSVTGVADDHDDLRRVARTLPGLVRIAFEEDAVPLDAGAQRAAAGPGS